MRSKAFFVAAALLVATALALAVSLLAAPVSSPVDMVSVNAALREAAAHWDDLSRADFSGCAYDFSVLDAAGSVRFTRGKDVSKSVYEAMQARDTVADLTNEHGAPYGKLLFRSGYAAGLRRRRDAAGWGLVGAAAALLAAAALYLAYLKKRVFTPFRKLERFAGRVAAGDLDLPLAMDKGNAFGAFTESFDILREELKKARQSEYLANRSKRELVASLSHDIKTPVASIKAVAETMAVTAPPAFGQSLHVIREKTEQIDTLVTDLFHASLKELERLPVAAEECYSSVIPAMIARADYRGKARGAASVPPCLVKADALRLQQVFDNVIGNSYKYADTDVDVSYRVEEGMLVITVADRGSGVTPEEAARATGKYFRGANAQGKSGAGLGLYLSAYFMEHMEGGLYCRAGKPGFCVDIAVPLA